MTRSFLDHYLPFLLVRADALLSEPLMDHLSADGVTVAEWRILVTLAEDEWNGTTIGSLAELVLLPQPTVSRWVERLESRGLVERSDGEGDRRRTQVHITAAGAREASRLADLAQRRFDESAGTLDPDDLRRLNDLLRRMIDRLAESAPCRAKTRQKSDPDNDEGPGGSCDPPGPSLVAGAGCEPTTFGL